MRREVRSIDGLDPGFVLRVYAFGLFVAFLAFSHFRVGVVLSDLGLTADRVVGVLWFAVFFWIYTIGEIDHPVTQRRAIGWLAVFHLFASVAATIHMRPDAMHDRASFYVVTFLMAVTIALAYTWLMANGDPRPGWNRVIDIFRPGAKPPSKQTTSDYEERIRAAAAQEERNHLARELHDSIKQQVFAIHTAAATAEQRLADDPHGTREAIAQVRESARDAMLEMDAMLDQMRAGPLTNASLIDAVRKQAEAVRLRTGADVTVDVDNLPAEHELPPAFRQAIARAAQESLNNVAKHARAAHVRVALGTRGGEFVLTVADDGAGYDTERVAAGMGVAGMRSRAAEASGDFSVDSHPGRGTTVRFAVPVISVPTTELARMAVWAAAAVLLLLLLSTRIGYVAFVMLPLPFLEFTRLSIAWWRARRITRDAA